MSLQAGTTQISTAKTHFDGTRTPLGKYTVLRVTVVLYLASCLFVYCFGQIAHWANGTPQNKLLGNCNWDCNWYALTVANGYDKAPRGPEGRNYANWAFFPLFPITVTAVKHLFGLDPKIAAVLTSKLEFFGAIFSFLLWLRPRLQSIDEYYLAGSLIALNPYLIYAHAGYGEPLYFTIVCLGLWALERHKWVLAGLFGAGVSANRLVGVLFSVLYAVYVLRVVGWRGVLKDRSLKILTGLALCPLGLVLYALFLYRRTGDALGFVHIEIAWGRMTASPLIVWLHSYYEGGWSRFFAFLVIFGLIVSVWLMRKRLELGVFLALCIVIPCASGSLQGLPRYIWWQPPLLFALFLWLRRSLSASIIYTIFAGGMAALMILEWFSKNIFVT